MLTGNIVYVYLSIALVQMLKAFTPVVGGVSRLECGFEIKGGTRGGKKYLLHGEDSLGGEVTVRRCILCGMRERGPGAAGGGSVC